MLPRHHRARRIAGVASLSLAITSAIGAIAVAENPAAAAAVIAAAQTVNCNLSSACINGVNAGSGSGIHGTSGNGFGVHGTSTSSSGVKGDSTSGFGVYATGAGGVYGYSANGLGVYGLSSSNTAVEGVSGGSGTGVYGYSTKGIALNGYTGGGPGVVARASGGNGADITGSYIGVIGRAPASGGYPFVATDQNANNLFWVTGSGDIYHKGGVYSFARTTSGLSAKSFSPQATSATVEDSGTAQLVNGAAAVRLDPTFAATIDANASYRVFITPGGDTNGLFVATKTPNGFVVRESRGGRSTVSFDYRILATAYGQTGQRMSLVTAATAAGIAAPSAANVNVAPPVLNLAPPTSSEK